MRPRPRAAVAAYLEVFVLVALAVGGSAVVYAGAAGLVSQRDPGVSVNGATIRQGEYFAIESLEVVDSGGTSFGHFLVSTGAPASASYCYSLYDPLERAPISSTCPTMSADPATVEVPAPLGPGEGVLVELTVSGQAFQPGSVSRVTVTTSGGAQQSLDLEVLAA